MAMESLNKALTLPDADKYKKQMLVEYSLLQMNYFNMGSGSYGQRDFQGARMTISGKVLMPTKSCWKLI